MKIPTALTTAHLLVLVAAASSSSSTAEDHSFSSADIHNNNNDNVPSPDEDVVQEFLPPKMSFSARDYFASLRSTSGDAAVTNGGNRVMFAVLVGLTHMLLFHPSSHLRHAHIFQLLL